MPSCIGQASSVGDLGDLGDLVVQSLARFLGGEGVMLIWRLRGVWTLPLFLDRDTVEPESVPYSPPPCISLASRVGSILGRMSGQIVVLVWVLLLGGYFLKPELHSFGRPLSFLLLSFLSESLFIGRIKTSESSSRESSPVSDPVVSLSSGFFKTALEMPYSVSHCFLVFVS